MVCGDIDFVADLKRSLHQIANNLAVQKDQHIHWLWITTDGARWASIWTRLDANMHETLHSLQLLPTMEEGETKRKLS